MPERCLEAKARQSELKIRENSEDKPHAAENFEITEGGNKMLIKQMSVFVENTTGRLADLTKILADNNIDIKASTIADTVDFGILRCIVADPEAATEILKKAGFTASITEVVAVSLEDKPGGLHKVLKILSDAQIGVDYFYSTIKPQAEEAVIMIKVEDPQKAVEVLSANSIKLFIMDELK